MKSDELTPPQAERVQINSTSDGDLLIWTIYNSPSDHPGKFIARPFSVRSQSPLLCHLAAESLDEIRRLLPPALYPMKRWTNDDPVIVEAWI